MNTDKLIKVELVNLDEITKKSLGYFLNSNLCTHAIMTDNSMNTNLYIIDICQGYDINFIRFLNARLQYIIILHMGETKGIEEKKNVLFLQKPINTKKLNLLLRIAQNNIKNCNPIDQLETDQNKQKKKTIKSKEVTHTSLFRAVARGVEKDIHQNFDAQKFVGFNKDISLNDLPANQIFLTKNIYLFHFLIKAQNLAKTNQANILISISHNTIVYDIKNKLFLFSYDSQKLRYLQSIQIIDTVDFSCINSVQLKKFDHHGKIQADQFIWQSTIQASKGRIPKDTDLTANVKMLAWPNFSHLQIFQYAIQISAVWSKYSLSLIETAKQLNIPQRYVFTLYCAMNTMGYVKIDTKSTKQTKIILNSESNKSTLFSRIISHIFK